MPVVVGAITDLDLYFKTQQRFGVTQAVAFKGIPGALDTITLFRLDGNSYLDFDVSANEVTVAGTNNQESAAVGGVVAVFDRHYVVIDGAFFKYSNGQPNTYRFRGRVQQVILG